jgi:hypothetical protein
MVSALPHPTSFQSRPDLKLNLLTDNSFTHYLD